MRRPLPAIQELATTSLLLVGCVVPATAQGSVPILPEPQQAGVERSYQGSYSESVSRDLFTACDGNSDDRLDVFEAADAIETLVTPRDSRSYARLDTDRDGFVTWPEFDALFRRGLKTGGRFVVRTCRPFVEPAPPPQPTTPLQQFLQVHDADGDGGLSPEEVTKLLERTGLPPTLAEPLRVLDLDSSGKIEEAELAPWFQSLPMAELAAAAGPSPLPQPWFDADEDRSGSIDLQELSQVLRRIDPGLLRWASALLAKMDKNADSKLGQDELPHPPAQPKAEPTPAQRAQQAPAR